MHFDDPIFLLVFLPALFTVYYSVVAAEGVSPRFAATLNVPDRQSPSGGDPLGNRPNMLKRLHKHKKWARAHLESSSA